MSLFTKIFQKNAGADEAGTTPAEDEPKPVAEEPQTMPKPSTSEQKRSDVHAVSHDAKAQMRPSAPPIHIPPPSTPEQPKPPGAAVGPLAVPKAIPPAAPKARVEPAAQAPPQPVRPVAPSPFPKMERAAAAASPPLTLELAPPAAEPKPRPGVPSEPDIVATETIDEGLALLEDVEAALGAIVQPDEAPAPAGRMRTSDPPRDVHELFLALAANHMRQVRDFMIGVKWGEPLPDWVGICEPAVASLLRASREMRAASFSEPLEAFLEALRAVARAGSARIEGPTKGALVAAYERLAGEMPEAFSLDAETNRRESVIVHSLLQQIAQVNKLAIDKLYEAGLTRIELLLLAKPDEIAHTTGIREEVAAQIVERFRAYKDQIETSPSDAKRQSERQKLTAIVARLRKIHGAYERASELWSDEAVLDKRKLRQARADILLDAKVLLARLGELGLLADIERAPFIHRIELLERYLREANGVRSPPR